MRTPTNPIVCLIIASLSVLIISSGTAFSKEKQDKPAVKPAATSQSPSKIVATVNGTAITKAEMDRAMKFMLAQNRVTTTLSDEEKKKAETAVLDQLISAELLYQAGKKLEIKDIDKLVDTQMSQNKAKFPSPEAYEKALKASGLTEKELKEFSRKEIYINNLIEKEIAPKVSISDADAKKFYDENKEKFKHDEQVRASHILIVADAKSSAEDKKKAKEKANAVLKRVKAGEDFAAVAKKESGCPSASQGGNLGYFGKGQMVPAFESVAFSLKPGEISDVVETQFGYHIIKVDEKKPAGSETFDQVKQKITAYLKVEKIQKNITEYIEKLRKEGKVEIKA